MNEKNIMIKSWLLKVIDDGSWEKYNDLHIDQIDNAFEKKAHWFEGGLKCYEYAVFIIKELELPYTIELAFSLKSKKIVKNYIIKDIESLKREFDSSPPSLYVFHDEWANLEEIKKKGTKLEDFMNCNKILGNWYYYQLFDERDREIRRVLYLI
ncbi:hypothetical protein [Pedobacter terrae]|uniref:hypothetical protein n=1 Tax=Pedobacter terrae TaxID=405671 RepID=UPI002FFBBA2D